MGNLTHSIFQTEILFGAPNHDDYTVAPKDGETKFVEIMWSRSNSFIYDEAYYPYYNLTVTESDGTPTGESISLGMTGILNEGTKTLPAKAMDDVVDFIQSTRDGKYKNYGIKWGMFDPYEFPDDFDPIPIYNVDLGQNPRQNTIFTPVEEEEVPEPVPEPEPEPIVEETEPELEPIAEPVVVDEEAIETTNDNSKVKSEPVNPEMEALKERLDEQESSYRQLLGMFIAQQNEEEEETITEEKQEGPVEIQEEPPNLLIGVAITGTLGALAGLGYYYYNRYK